MNCKLDLGANFFFELHNEECKLNLFDSGLTGVSAITEFNFFTNHKTEVDGQLLKGTTKGGLLIC